MKFQSYSTANIYYNSYEEIAQMIYWRMKRWRCDRVMAFVAPDGTIRCRDLGVDSGKNDPEAGFIIGTFNRSIKIEDIEDAVLYQMKEMNLCVKAEVA